VLPYLTQQSFYDRYEWDDLWNGPGNAFLVDEIPDRWQDNAGDVWQGVMDANAEHTCS
jgi:hypothetical protein